MESVQDLLMDVGDSLNEGEVEEIVFLLKDYLQGSKHLGVAITAGRQVTFLLFERRRTEKEDDLQILKDALKEINREDLEGKIQRYFATVNHLSIFNGFALVCHLGISPQTFLRNVNSIKYDWEQIIGVYRGGGGSGIEYIKLSDWESESINYFDRYFQRLSVVTIPSEKDDIMDTLSSWCKDGGRESEGFVVNGYDIVSHYEFLGIGQKDIRNMFSMKSYGDPFSRYIAFSKNKKIILNIRFAETFDNHVVENCVSDIKLLTGLYLNELSNSGVRLVTIVAIKNKMRDTPKCHFCEAYLISEEILRDPNIFEGWWGKTEETTRILEALQSIDRSNSFKLFSSKLIAFMAHARNPNIPNFSLQTNQQIAQTHLLLTMEQMNVVFMRDKHIFIKGSYGSGKTIIALKKLEIMLRNIHHNEIVVFLNYDERSAMHLQVSEYVKKIPVVNPKMMQVCDITDAFQQENTYVTISSNNYGLSLSKILTIIKEKADFLKKYIHIIIDEYDGEDLSMDEVVKVVELLNFLKNSFVILLVQPLEKHRVYQNDGKTHNSDTNQFKELQKYVKVVELKNVFRTTLQIHDLLNHTKEYLQKQENTFNLPTRKKISDEKAISKKEPRIQKKQTTSSRNKSQIMKQSESTEDETRNIPDTYFHSIRDLDEAFRRASSDTRRRPGTSKTLSNFRYITNSRPGHSIAGPLPKLFRYEINHLQVYDKSILSLSCIFKVLDIKSKKTVLLHFEKENPHLIVTTLKFLELLIYSNNDMESFVKEGKSRNCILVTNFRHVNGMEFENLIIVLKRDEYFLRHYIPLCVSRCTCDLSILLWEQLKSKNPKKNRIIGGKVKETFKSLLPSSKSRSNNNISCDALDIFMRKDSVELWEVSDCEKCDENSKLYCISNHGTHQIALGVNIKSNEYIVLEKKLYEMRLKFDTDESHGNDDEEHLEKILQHVNRMDENMFPEPIEGLWDWYHDGKTKTGDVQFRDDKTVKSSFFKDHGTWDYNRSTGIFTWDTQKIERIHKLYYNSKSDKAILYEPIRNPPSAMTKRTGRAKYSTSK